MVGRRLVLASILVALVVPAAATAGNATTVTGHLEFSSVSGVLNPCNGGSYTEIYSAEGVFHLTTLGDGSLHFALEEQQTISLLPSNPSQPSYTGTSIATNQLDIPSGGTQEGLIASTTLLRGSDGSLIVDRNQKHFLLTPSGVQFFKEHEALICLEPRGS